MSSEETRQEPENRSDAENEESQSEAATLEPGEHKVAIDVGAVTPDDVLREQLVTQLDDLTQRVQALEPEYASPAFSPKRLLALVEQLLSRLPQELQLDAIAQLQNALRQDAFDPDLWKGMWYMLNYTLQYNVGVVKRRITGEFDTDKWGLDWEMVDVVRPFFNFLYQKYFRVETTGLENVPLEGRALLVANHSGQLPFDGMMIGMAILTDHPSQRLVRTLYAAILPSIPYVSTILTRLGQTLATVDNGTRLLEEEELVAIFPEGYKGTGKLFRDRYRLARFGRGGFARMALNTQAPIIPISVVGSEETYITLAKLPTLSGITGIPYLPITATFPWLGLLGVVPLPTKWYIDFGKPISVDGYGPDAAHNPVYISQLSDQVRNIVQQMVHDRLAQRRSIFFG
jgi:1-acyl-sn-glycerol-3-phosphate acyltransferase